MKKIAILLVLTFLILQSFAKQHNTKATHSDTLDVLHYTIDLSIDFGSQEISGFTNLQIVPKIDNLNLISLDLLALTIDSILIDGVLTSNYTYNDILLNITTFAPFAITDTFDLEIYYHGHPQEDPSGFGGFSFTSAYAYSIGVAFTSNPHNYGRVWYPCIDDFVDRATYDFYITNVDTKTAVCNGTLMSEIDNGDGTKTFHWTMHDEIPTYLTSVAVANYVAVRDTFNGLWGQIPIAIYVLAGDSVDAVNSFINIKEILTGFENRFGPYRWERIGLVAVPLGGGMEHATNIAYGDFLINGALTYEWLYAHELSHHWFGDLVTCREAEEMWINEGWAVFCESIYVENLYGHDDYIEYYRDNHKYVLRYSHIKDGGYRALVGIPHEYTYGTTVYDKGADVVHSIRGYLGDSLFFPAVQAYLDTFAMQDVNSEDLKNILTSETGIDMTDFFDAWVYAPGFPHFSIDSFNVVSVGGGNFDVTVYIRQKLKGAVIFANSNRVEITFMNNNWVQHTELMEFSGEYGVQTFTIPINPQIAMLDINEKLSDAITDHYQTINSTGIINIDNQNTYFSIDVQQITDSAFIRIEHNWVPPEPFQTPMPGTFISDYRYWKVDGMFPVDFIAKGRFYYSKSTSASAYYGYLDNTLITTPYVDSLIVLYRSNPSEDWTKVNSVRAGSIIAGNLIIDTLLLGEYALGFYDWNLYVSQNSLNYKVEKFNIFPNPADDIFNIEFDITNKGKIEIFNILGEQVFSERIYPHQELIKWQPKNLNKGIYIVKLTENNKQIGNKKIIYF